MKTKTQIYAQNGYIITTWSDGTMTIKPKKEGKNV